MMTALASSVILKTAVQATELTENTESYMDFSLFVDSPKR
jgi:hypothetical protein